MMKMPLKDSPLLTSASGASGRFDTTHWSVVLLAGESRSPQSAEALEKLCRTYWQPLYVFIRRQGHGLEDAQDLTQEFFARLFERNDLSAVDPRKGKFRTFLLAALTHFLANERDRLKAAKRGGGKKIVPLHEIESGLSCLREPASDLSPDKLFDQRWAITVLEQALRQLREEMASGGKSIQFEQLKIYLTDDTDEGGYRAVAEHLGMTNQSVAVAVHRLRRRYQELVRAEVAQTVSSVLEVDEEIRHLFEALNLDRMPVALPVAGDPGSPRKHESLDEREFL